MKRVINKEENDHEEIMMRLDKYLKVSRLIKRRTVAKEIADKGRISINGKVAKSSTDVKIGDELTLLFGNKTLVVKVTDMRETTKKDEAENMYEVVSDTNK
jgi:ribosomal 50S subunit-recycling heat shock protein